MKNMVIFQTSPATAYIRFETKIADGDKKLF
jgi:hypothetical protein